MANFCLKNLNKFRLLEKIEFFSKFAWKIEIFYTQLHDPQISNQIDAAGQKLIQPKMPSLRKLLAWRKSIYNGPYSQSGQNVRLQSPSTPW